MNQRVVSFLVLDSDENISLSEGGCKESAGSANETDDIPSYPDIYISLGVVQNGYHYNSNVPGRIATRNVL
ncbi:hypothetical protein TNCV_1625091 [Trichonephila clavipes]|nr:hypothetical protein TNCV_1625091 [Trichonephila clavipes]